MNGQPLESPFGSAFGTSIVVLTLLTVAILWILVGPGAGGVLLIAAAAVALAWLVSNRTIPMLGIVLAVMSVHSLAVILARFYGFPNITLVSASTKEIPLLLLTFILGRRNGLRLAAPDWFLLAFFMLALTRSSFGGGIRGLIDDFGFLIPYVAGRVTVLTDTQERLWAKCAVWIAAVLSAVGMVEVFVVGDSLRRAVYTAELGEENLFASFWADSFAGVREASTMTGPLTFAALCMVALIIWWVYLRNPVPAGMIFMGLVCALTRSAWMGTAVAISVLALRLGQKRRLASYVLLGTLVFAAAIPILGIRDYVSGTRTGQDDSEQVHRASLLAGLEYVASHPLGTGAESVGPRMFLQNRAAVTMESTFLTLAAEYGVLAGLCFIGFLWAAMHRTWKNRTPLGYVATAILMAFGIMMVFLPMHQDFRLNCWVWFPIGLAVRSAIGQGIPTASGPPEGLGKETA